MTAVGNFTEKGDGRTSTDVGGISRRGSGALEGVSRVVGPGFPNVGLGNLPLHLSREAVSSNA